MLSFLVYQCDNCKSFVFEPQRCPKCDSSIFTPKQIVFTPKEIELLNKHGTEIIDIVAFRAKSSIKKK